MKGFNSGLPLKAGLPMAAAILAVATLLVWRNSLSGGLWADDAIYLLYAREASLKGLLNIWLIKEEYLRDYWMQYISFTGRSIPGDGGLAAYWRPVTNLITALEVRIWGNWYAGYHLTNIIGHFTTALVLHRISTKLGFSYAWALGISLVWMALPSHTITISWISARHDIFAALFALLSFNAYLSWRKKPQRMKIVSGALLYLLALGCKAIVLPLPGVVFIHALVSHWNGKYSDTEAENRVPSTLKTLLLYCLPLMLISIGMFLLMMYWPIPDGFKRLTDDYILALHNRNPWITFVLPIQYFFQFFFGIIPLDLENIPWPTFALTAAVFIWWTLFTLLAIYRKNTAFILGVAWFSLMLLPLMFTVVGMHYIYSATPGGALAIAAILKHVMYKPPLWKKIFAAGAGLYMACFWTFSAMLGSAWYSFLPQANELIMNNLKNTVPALEDRSGKPYRKIYILNAWSMIHYLGYQIRLEYNQINIPIRILTIDPEYYPEDLELPFSPQNALLTALLMPFRTERHIDYKMQDEHTIDVIRWDGPMFNTILEKKVLLGGMGIKNRKTYTLDKELGPGNSYSAKIEESTLAGQPTRLRFHFEHPLDDPGVLFLLQQGSNFMKLDFGKGLKEEARSAR